MSAGTCAATGGVAGCVAADTPVAAGVDVDTAAGERADCSAGGTVGDDTCESGKLLFPGSDPAF